jgi:hypothetical protein
MVQVVIAIGLLILANQQLRGTEWGHTAGGAPARRICIALNAPAFFFHDLSLWDWIPGLSGVSGVVVSGRIFLTVDDFIWLIGIALLWYLMGVIIEVKLQKKKPFALTFAPLRVGFDLILILMALVFASAAFDSWHYIPGWAVGVMSAVLLLAWSLGLLVYCGYDVVSWIRERVSYRKA